MSGKDIPLSKKILAYIISYSIVFTPLIADMTYITLLFISFQVGVIIDDIDTVSTMIANTTEDAELLITSAKLFPQTLIFSTLTITGLGCLFSNNLIDNMKQLMARLNEERERRKVFKEFIRHDIRLIAVFLALLINATFAIEALQKYGINTQYLILLGEAISVIFIAVIAIQLTGLYILKHERI